MIGKDDWDKLSYKEQESLLVRCFWCQMKFNPFDLIKYTPRFVCKWCMEMEDNNEE
jgi:hypothetical protein